MRPPNNKQTLTTNILLWQFHYLSLTIYACSIFKFYNFLISLPFLNVIKSIPLNIPLWNSLNTSENCWFSNIFRGYNIYNCNMGSMGQKLLLIGKSYFSMKNSFRFNFSFYLKNWIVWKMLKMQYMKLTDKNQKRISR